MSRSNAAAVVVLHPELPALSRRDRARLQLIDLLRDLDPASQQVLVDQLAQSVSLMRRVGPTGAVLRGERGPVKWSRGLGPRRLVAPGARRYLRERALA